MLLPKPLLSIADIIEEKNTSISLILKCNCGCSEFFLLQNEETEYEEAKRAKWESLLHEYNGGGYSDKSGNLFLTKKSIFGIKVKEIKINKSDIPQYVTILKTRCSVCGKEHVIYDSRTNGYNAMTESDIIKNLKEENMPRSYKAINDKSAHVKIKITNDISPSIFIEEFPESPIENHANAYSHISVYLQKDNRYKCVFEKQTK